VFTSKNFHPTLRLAAVAVFIFCFFARCSAFPIADEVDFMKPIEGWLIHGPQIQGLWHAPLYPWFLSVLGKIFGFSAANFRSLGFLCALIAMGLVYRAACLIKPKLEEWQLTLIVWLTALNPVLIGSSLLLDYDTTLLVASTALYFFLLVRHYYKPQKNMVLVFGGALALALLSKETTPLVYPLGLIVLDGPKKGFVKSTQNAFAVGLVGVALFCLVALSWCEWFDIPFSAIFQMDLLGLKLHGAGGGPSSDDIWNNLWIKNLSIDLDRVAAFFWNGLRRFTSLARAGAMAVGRSRFGCSDDDVYVCVAPNDLSFSEVYGADFDLVAVAIRSFSVEKGRKTLCLSIERCACVNCGVIFSAADPFQVLYGRTLKELPSAILPFLLVFAVWVGIYQRRSRLRFLVCALVLGHSVAYVREIFLSSYSATYWYGESALHEADRITREWRKEHPSGAIYSPAKDIAFVTRAQGTMYMPMDLMLGAATGLCEKSEVLVLTRVREESSFFRAFQMAPYRKCLKITVGRDLAIGMR
jgi:hypothetical protein